jgi:hypothetical protein
MALQEVYECHIRPNKELIEFKTKEKAVAELSRLPLEQRLHKMIEDGATVDEVKEAIRASGLKVEGDNEVPQKKSKIEKTNELPEGYTRNEQGQLVAPISSEELFARMGKQKPPEERNENEDKDKDQPDS